MIIGGGDKVDVRRQPDKLISEVERYLVACVGVCGGSECENLVLVKLYHDNTLILVNHFTVRAISERSLSVSCVFFVYVYIYVCLLLYNFV